MCVLVKAFWVHCFAITTFFISGNISYSYHFTFCRLTTYFSLPLVLSCFHSLTYFTLSLALFLHNHLLWLGKYTVHTLYFEAQECPSLSSCYIIVSLLENKWPLFLPNCSGVINLFH